MMPTQPSRPSIISTHTPCTLGPTSTSVCLGRLILASTFCTVHTQQSQADKAAVWQDWDSVESGCPASQGAQLQDGFLWRDVSLLLLAFWTFVVKDSVTQADLELLAILLPQPPRHWALRLLVCIPHLACFVSFDFSSETVKLVL